MYERKVYDNDGILIDLYEGYNHVRAGSHCKKCGQLLEECCCDEIGGSWYD